MNEKQKRVVVLGMAAWFLVAFAIHKDYGRDWDLLVLWWSFIIVLTAGFLALLSGKD